MCWPEILAENYNLCTYAAQHSNCVLTLHQHNGRVVFVETTEWLKSKEQRAMLIRRSNGTVPKWSDMSSGSTT
jgi:hypothetical protein